MAWILREETKDRAVKVYIAECLKLAPQGKTLKRGLADILDSLDNTKRKEKPTRSAEEIVTSVVEKAGLVLKKNGN